MSNVVVAAHMENEAITEHWFGEEAKGSDRSGRQCGHGDDRAEEEGDDNDDERVLTNQTYCLDSWDPSKTTTS
ncbi:uncharacterized protein DS421_7g202250 [Arachis hypogaea]|nr:uncharacterized protein DS421_7g202250 [Arachis hypogaea]